MAVRHNAVGPLEVAVVVHLTGEFGRARHRHSDLLPALPVAPEGRRVFFVGGAGHDVKIGIFHRVSIARAGIKSKNFIVFFC